MALYQAAPPVVRQDPLAWLSPGGWLAPTTVPVIAITPERRARKPQKLHSIRLGTGVNVLDSYGEYNGLGESSLDPVVAAQRQTFWTALALGIAGGVIFGLLFCRRIRQP